MQKKYRKSKPIYKLPKHEYGPMVCLKGFNNVWTPKDYNYNLVNVP